MQNIKSMKLVKISDTSPPKKTEILEIKGKHGLPALVSELCRILNTNREFTENFLFSVIGMAVNALKNEDFFEFAFTDSNNARYSIEMIKK